MASAMEKCRLSERRACELNGSGASLTDRFLRCSSGLSQGAVRKMKSRRSSVLRRRSAESTHPRIFSTVSVRRDETWLDGLRAKVKESFCSLAPSIHLVVVRPCRKSRAFR